MYIVFGLCVAVLREGLGLRRGGGAWLPCRARNINACGVGRRPLSGLAFKFPSRCAPRPPRNRTDAESGILAGPAPPPADLPDERGPETASWLLGKCLAMAARHAERSSSILSHCPSSFGLVHVRHKQPLGVGCYEYFNRMATIFPPKLKLCAQSQSCLAKIDQKMIDYIDLLHEIVEAICESGYGRFCATQ